MNLFKTPKPQLPPPPPPVPTIDTAAQNDELSRKFARRTGMKKNIYAGSQTGTNAPAVGTKALLGQSGQ